MSKSFLHIASYPRGLRNNNPGNIKAGINWEGAIGDDGVFVTFKNIAYGIRAMATDIGNDIRLDGKNSLQALVYEYAPPTENNTAVYLQDLVTWTGYGPTQALPRSETMMVKLIRAFMNKELGVSYSALISDADIKEGLALMNDGLKGYFGISGSAGNNDNTGVVVGLGVAAALLYWLYTIKK